MFTVENQVRFSEIDRSGTMTLPAVINYFQDCSTFQSEAIGLGMEALKANHRAWVLSSWQIVVERYPTMCENIKVSTWSTGFEGLYGTRNFMMLDEQGQKAAYANSIWVYVDVQTGRPVLAKPQEMEGYEVEPPLEMEYAPRKIKRPKMCKDLEPFPVRRYHIDTNAHVNNAIYVQMAGEFVPEERRFHQVRVSYKKAAVYGDIIYPRMAKEEERTVVELCDESGSPYAIVEYRR
ncbi:MAG: thioesterase [Lachnospiraceae bacterium]